MKKLLFINIFLLIVLSSVYAINDNGGLLSKKDAGRVLVADNSESVGKLNLSKKNDTKKSNLENASSMKISDYGTIYNDVVQMIKNNYVEDVNDDKFFEASLSGMLSSLDPHSAYFSEKEYNELVSDTQGEFSGLGINITMDSYLVKVIAPIDDSPAYKAGIKAGDYISEIDGKSVVGMSLIEASNMMRGKDNKDRGIVEITVLRTGESKPLKFKIKRDLIKTDSVKGRAEGDIVYIRISSFTEQTYADLIKEFNKIENEIGKDNVKGLVLDLRNNPGGLLNPSVFVSDAFLDKGKKIVSIKGKNGTVIQEFYSKNEEDLIPGLPMAVLIDGGSASASEIVAGALQDNNRAIIVGTQSFGKGSVQSVIPLKNGGGIKLTIARYYTPNDISIQAEGIKPDIEVKLARLEEIDNSAWSMKEKSLKGHLENNNENELVNKELKKQLKTANESMYNKDYQLARAIDLLLGIDFYNQSNKK